MSNANNTKKPDVIPTLLLILDGWGLLPPEATESEKKGAASLLAATPNLDALWACRPHSRLAASGREVGLPAGYMGNSEVGHLNIGSGRVVYQDMTRIDVALEDGSFARNPVLKDLFARAKAGSGRLHLAGLLSDGGVHSHIGHLEALCKMASDEGLTVRIHCIMDGRDTSPKSGLEFLTRLEKSISGLKNTAIASLIGRFYAMDRDKRWERVKEAWDLLAHGVSDANLTAKSPRAALEAAYQEGKTDEFISPVLIETCGKPGMEDGDGLFFFNFRADRMRELVAPFIQKDFNAFERGQVPKLCGIASMTPYEATFDIPVAFPKEAVSLGLGETISRAGLKQLRLAETEKYAHVTYFFNGGVEEPMPGEERILVPSPRDVPTYDLKPAMSAREVTDKFVEAWNSEKYDLVVVNLANGDMVGHTGNLKAAEEACAVVDECVGRMREAVENRGGQMLIIADHGNCEVMLTPEGSPQTSHTTNLVPCILIEPSGQVTGLADGKLADVAPTLLDLMGLAPTEKMNGVSLLKKAGRKNG